MSKEKTNFTVALAGNPNVGKSTIFNILTGMKQHTGNWTGKTVECAFGYCEKGRYGFNVTDLPGTYSLLAKSEEERLAREYICSGSADVTVVVCDCSCLERNLNLALQILNVTENVILCVNLLDEAKRQGIEPDLSEIEKALGVKTVGTCGAKGLKGIEELLEAIDSFIDSGRRSVSEEYANRAAENGAPDEASVRTGKKGDTDNTEAVSAKSEMGEAICGGCVESISEAEFVSGIFARAEEICRGAFKSQNQSGDIRRSGQMKKRREKLDRILTGRVTGVLCMLLLLCGVLWLTIIGANYPSELLFNLFSSFEVKLTEWLTAAGLNTTVVSLLCGGVYRVLMWVVSVMMPPMAIFFPLFTLLEDFGYLPRIAFNLDGCYKWADACGKQALTHCMGFGCNSVGITGCRIIDSPRERMLALMTNNFAPCNGRFPLIITLSSCFAASSCGRITGSLISALAVGSAILIGIFASFGISKFLSSLFFKGEAVSFILELPPFRRPRFVKVAVRSLVDRTLVILGRAAMVAAPAGAVIWILMNIKLEGASLLYHMASFLQPVGKLLGMDGVILSAFILGFPANEIVMPIILTVYSAGGSLSAVDEIGAIRDILIANGWTVKTAVCTCLFCLFHWPCSTTCITIYKETKSVKNTLGAVAIPTLTGIAVCIIMNILLSLAAFIL